MSALFILSYFLTGPQSVCLSPLNFGYSNIAHFLFTLLASSYFHLSFFHIFWNMSVWVYYGGVYERKWGSAKFALNIFISGLLSNLIHVLLAGVISYIPFQPEFIYNTFVRTCSVGISGVLFFLISLDCFDPELPPNSGQQIFGLMPVPKKYYPWIMLALMQLMVKNVSFLGHLGGLLLGLMYARDRQHIMHPKREWIEYFESTSICSTYLEPRAMWIPKNQLPGAVIPPSIAFSEALQQQFKSMYPGLNTQAHAAGEQAAPVQLGASGFTSMDPSTASPASSGSTPTNKASSSAFPGPGHVLGR